MESVTGRSAKLLVLAALGTAGFVASNQGCTRPSNRYCDAETACTDPKAPFCDANAEYQDHLNRCIENPFGTCTTLYDCTFEAPICDDFAGCIPCTRADNGNDACEALGKGRDTCNSDGRCIACRTDPDCDSDFPSCNRDTLLCEPCEAGPTGHTNCQRRNADEPWCSDTGACVECLGNEHCTNPNLPICSPGGQCVGCYEHEHCASEVCDLESGACVAATFVVYADSSMGTVAPCGDAPGAAACLTLADAVSATAPSIGRTWIRLAPGSYASAGDDRVIVQDASLQLIGTDRANTTITGGDPEPGLLVLGGGHLLVDRVTVKGAGDGIACVNVETPPSLNVLRSAVTGNSKDGIHSESCPVVIESSKIGSNGGFGVFLRDLDSSLELTRSEIYDNAQGGLSMENCAFTVTNNFIHGNGTTGDADSPVGGVRISAPLGTSGTFAFNTVTNNVAAPNVGQGVSCTTTPAMTLTNSIVFRKSVGDSILSGNCNWAYSAIEGGAPGTGNLGGDPRFVNTGVGDYHLQPNSPCEGAADPDATINVDFDGDARPLGTGRDIGADEIAP